MVNKITFNHYQKEALKVALYPNIGSNPVYPALGMGGECGEVQDKIKKILRDKKGIYSKEDKLEIAKEISDVLWYMAALSKEMGFTLGEVAMINLKKCRSRYKRNKIQGSGDNR